MYESILISGAQPKENRVLTRTGYMLDMAATPFSSAGQFFGSDITLSHPSITFVEAGGSWAGRFPEVSDADGFPGASLGYTGVSGARQVEAPRISWVRTTGQRSSTSRQGPGGDLKNLVASLCLPEDTISARFPDRLSWPGFPATNT